MSSENTSTTSDETRDEQTAVASLRSLTLNEQPRHPDLEDDIPLLESFHRAQQQYQAIQDSTAPPAQKQPLIQQCIARFTQIGEVVRAAGLFSLNEELDDINTVDLQYLTVPYYMADLLMQVQLIDNERTLVMRHRFAALLQAVIHLKKFLDHCENLKLMNDQDIARYHRGGGHGDSRQSRIDAYKREQASRELVTSLLNKRNASRTRGQLLSDDERENSDDERRYTLAIIDWYIQKALDHLDMANREIPILKHGLTQETTSQQQPQPGITPQQLIQPSSTSSTSKPKVYRIDNSQAVNNPIPSHMSSFMHRVAAPAPAPQPRALPPSTSTSTSTSNPIFQSVAASTIDSMASQRANIRDNVFRDSNPYTLTVEEWSAQQHAQHAPSQSHQFSIANARPSERRVEHKEEEEDEQQDQSEAAQDAATLKARNWDNWKDEHEKGIGNRMK